MVRQELRLGKGWVALTPRLEGEEIIGYALVRYDEDLVGLTRLGVHPSRQGFGVGRRLLTAVLREAATLILTVQKDNLPAMKLYFSHGFEIVGHLHAANAWVMKRAKALSERA